jgi:hypothetical protein
MKPEPAPSEVEYWEAELRARLNGKSGSATAPPAARLLELAELLGLSALELDIVAALWTTAQSPAWRAELAAGQIFAGHLTVIGLALAFGHVPRARLPSESPLRLWRIVAEQPFIEGTAALSLDPHLIAWLNEEAELDRALIGRVRLLQPSFELPSWQVESYAAQIRSRLHADDRVRVCISGGDPASTHACAASIAKRLGLLVLRVRPDLGSGEEARELGVRVQRQAFLDRCAPCWSAQDAAYAWPEEVPVFPVQFVCGGERLPTDARMRDVSITIHDPDADERRALWLFALPAAASWPATALDDLALRFEASPEEILNVAAMEPRDAQEASQRIRSSTVHDLGDLARPLPCPFSWEDLVVPTAVRERLEDIAFEARERAQIWASPEAARLYPQGRGLVALLSGPPGTGKTMSAQVIAADLGLDLLRVDISRVLSKWVGETAQHLQKVLSSACSRRAVLLFDEADALFGKRIEDTRQAQDHFINMDMGHLMIALESYTGVVLLATNLRANIDAAFVRRIRHAIDFTVPDASARECIWSRALQALFAHSSDSVNAEAIARVARIEATGAQIKNAALSAAFAARKTGAPLDATLLGQMLARELAKDGQGMSARELSATLEAPL